MQRLLVLLQFRALPDLCQASARLAKKNSIMHELIFATGNPNKVQEVQDAIPEGYRLLSLKDIGFSGEIPEEGATLQENARQKAEFIYSRYRKDCFADDTGLVVQSLGGEPGVYSARYAGPKANSEDNMRLLLERLQPYPDRQAAFRTVFALVLNGQLHYFVGEAKGQIIANRRGNEGFGYDPVFVPEGYDKTFAEMTREEKNRISHRGKALRALVEFLGKQ